jgi:hypothetical protein
MKDQFKTRTLCKHRKECGTLKRYAGLEGTAA